MLDIDGIKVVSPKRSRGDLKYPFFANYHTCYWRTVEQFTSTVLRSEGERLSIIKDTIDTIGSIGVLYINNEMLNQPEGTRMGQNSKTAPNPANKKNIRKDGYWIIK